MLQSTMDIGHSHCDFFFFFLSKTSLKVILSLGINSKDLYKLQSQISAYKSELFHNTYAAGKVAQRVKLKVQIVSLYFNLSSFLSLSQTYLHTCECIFFLLMRGPKSQPLGYIVYVCCYQGENQ